MTPGVESMLQHAHSLAEATLSNSGKSGGDDVRRHFSSLAVEFSILAVQFSAATLLQIHTQQHCGLYYEKKLRSRASWIYV